MHVATPLDPATARKGESLFEFLPRCVGGTFFHACELERKRLGGAWWTPRNRIVQGAAASAAWALVLARYSRNWRAIPVFYLMGLASASLLEAVNFVEHWGLERRLVRPGVYEPVDPRHSWNAANVLTNTVLYKLQRHSDHHANASRPYELLRNFVESPQLPTG